MTPSQREYVSKFPYQNLVGALLYLAINTRPDISYAVGVLARFNTYPNFRACKALIRVLLYLRGTQMSEFSLLAIFLIYLATLMPSGLMIWTPDDQLQATWCTQRADQSRGNRDFKPLS